MTLNPGTTIVLTSQHVSSVFHVRTTNGIGSTFVYQDDRGFYFASAAHLFKSVRKGEHVLFQHRDGWIPFTITDIAFNDQGSDLVCYTLDMPLKLDGALNFKPHAHSFVGGEVKFIGFPHGLNGEYPSDHGFVTPLVRTAYFSGVVLLNGVSVTILDGFNNPGYSGAPVYVPGTASRPVLAGVISGYRNEAPAIGQLYRKEGHKEVEVEGHFIKRLNSGMIYAEGRHALNKTAETLTSRIQSK
jgi:hypothetical protein